MLANALTHRERPSASHLDVESLGSLPEFEAPLVERERAVNLMMSGRKRQSAQAYLRACTYVALRRPCWLGATLTALRGSNHALRRSDSAMRCYDAAKCCSDAPPLLHCSPVCSPAAKRCSTAAQSCSDAGPGQPHVAKNRLRAVLVKPCAAPLQGLRCSNPAPPRCSNAAQTPMQPSAALMQPCSSLMQPIATPMQPSAALMQSFPAQEQPCAVQCPALLQCSPALL